MISPRDAKLLRYRVLKLLIDQEEKGYNGSLEEYLRAIYGAVMARKEQSTLSIDTMLDLLTAGFSQQPVPFNEAWLEYKNPPLTQADYDMLMSLPEDERDFDPADLRVVDDELTYVREILQFQIADLHRMKDVDISDPFILLGMESPTGNIWYNFDPYSYLLCGTQQFMDALEEDENEDEDEDVENELFNIEELDETESDFENEESLRAAAIEARNQELAELEVDLKATANEKYPDTDEPNWELFGVLLECGRVYE